MNAGLHFVVRTGDNNEISEHKNSGQMMNPKVSAFFDEATFTVTYVVTDPDTKQCAVIDPVLDYDPASGRSSTESVDRVIQFVQTSGLTLTCILETHVHADHITGAHQIRKDTGANIVISKHAEVSCADLAVSDGDEISCGSINLKVIYSPGHTATCCCYLMDGMVFTGDALMVRGTGRTDFQGGSAAQLYDMITQKLFTLPDETLVYPAHNYKGMLVSTIGEEKRCNPRLGKGKEAFIEIMNNLNLAHPKKMDVAVPANLRCGER